MNTTTTCDQAQNHPALAYTRDDAVAFNAYAPAAHDPILKGMTRGEVFAQALAKCEEILAQTGQE